MRTLSRSSSITVALGYRKGRAQAASWAHQALNQRLTVLLVRQPNGPISNLEDLGRWTYQAVKTLLIGFQLPEGVIIIDISISFYSEPNTRGAMVMKLDCRTGKMEIF